MIICLNPGGRETVASAENGCEYLIFAPKIILVTCPAATADRLLQLPSHAIYLLPDEWNQAWEIKSTFARG